METVTSRDGTPIAFDRLGAGDSRRAGVRRLDLARGERAAGRGAVPTERAASVKTPTLVIAGGADIPWMRQTATALAEAIPEGEVRFLEGQRHDVDPAVLGPVLVEFFGDRG